MSSCGIIVIVHLCGEEAVRLLLLHHYGLHPPTFRITIVAMAVNVCIAGMDPGLSAGGHQCVPNALSRGGGGGGMLPQKFLKIRVSKMAISSILRQISDSFSTTFLLVL